MKPVPAIVITIAGLMLAGLLLNQLDVPDHAPVDAGPAAMSCVALLLRLAHRALEVALRRLPNLR